jgi:hypothetical protein
VLSVAAPVLSVVGVEVAAVESVPEVAVSSAKAKFEVVTARLAETSMVRSKLLFICPSYLQKRREIRAWPVSGRNTPRSLIARIMPDFKEPELLSFRRWELGPFSSESTKHKQSDDHVRSGIAAGSASPTRPFSVSLQLAANRRSNGGPRQG